MKNFIDKYNNFLAEFDKGKIMVLSSSENDKVTSRMMSVVRIDGCFYFQTDKSFRKYNQLINNPQAALCIDNIQIEGICEEIGRPSDFLPFCNLYMECFKVSYEMYSNLENERLFRFKPTYIERWLYEDSIPFIEIFNINTKEYELIQYKGI